MEPPANHPMACPCEAADWAMRYLSSRCNQPGDLRAIGCDICPSGTYVAILGNMIPKAVQTVKPGSGSGEREINLINLGNLPPAELTPPGSLILPGRTTVKINYTELLRRMKPPYMKSAARAFAISAERIACAKCASCNCAMAVWMRRPVRWSKLGARWV